MSIEQRLDIDLEAFSLDAVKRSAYRFSDKFAFDLTVDGRTARCTFTFPGSASPEAVEASIIAFRKELLDQDLRQAIRSETQHVRNVILAHAFSQSGLVNDEPLQNDK
jgi:His-Xaa-Ser system protein HxsD